jgi:hypothetical protein
MFLTRSLPFVAVLGTLACTSADILRLDSTPRPQTRPESIQLIAKEPTQRYVVIAIVSARQDYGGNARERLIKEAAKLGGNAVLLDAGSLTRISNGAEHGSTGLQVSGKVIVFTDSTRAN